MDSISAHNTVWCYLLEKDTQNISHISLATHNIGTSALEIKGPANAGTRSGV